MVNASAPAGRAARRLLALAPPAAVAAGGALFAGHLVNELLLDRATAQLYASAERTAWTWAAAMATLAAGLGAGLLGFVRGDRVALGLAGLLAFFGLDDFVEVHERLGFRAAEAAGLPEWVGPRAWTVLYLPLLALALVLGARVARTLDDAVRRPLAVGAVLLVAGFALEVGGIATKRVSGEGIGTLHEVRAGAEEAVELAGWILVSAALCAGGLAGAGGATPAERSTNLRRPRAQAPRRASGARDRAAQRRGDA